MFGLFYNRNELSILRRETKGQKVKIKYDPTDISVIYVADSKNGLFIPVPAVDQEYTQGLSLFQHDVIRNYARKIADEFVDSDALWRARKKIEEIVERAWDKSRKSSTRTRLARFKGIGLRDYWNSFEEECNEHNFEEVTMGSEQDPEQLCMSPADTQHSTGVSDIGISFDGHHAESQSSETPQDLTGLSVLLDAKSSERCQKNPKKDTCRSAPKQKNNSTGAGTDIGAKRADVDESFDTSEDSRGDEWEADYGRMDEEVLRWQK